MAASGLFNLHAMAVWNGSLIVVERGVCLYAAYTPPQGERRRDCIASAS